MGVKLEQARELRAPYAAYCARLEQLGAESAAALATVQEVQQASWGNGTLLAVLACRRAFGLPAATLHAVHQPATTHTPSCASCLPMRLPFPSCPCACLPACLQHLPADGSPVWRQPERQRGAVSPAV
jgi:hypothetical protein